MSLVELAAEVSASKAKETGCKVGRFRATLNERDAQAFDTIITTLSVAEAAALLADNHIINVGSTTLALHRRGACTCPR